MDCPAVIDRLDALLEGRLGDDEIVHDEVEVVRVPESDLVGFG